MQDLTGQNFSFATDGACAICSEMVVLVDYLKKMLSNLDAPISAIHCILHQKLVCGKTLQLDNVMDVVVNIKNPQPFFPPLIMNIESFCFHSELRSFNCFLL